jgi:hypothetical protein
MNRAFLAASIIVAVNASLYEQCDSLFEEFKIRWSKQYNPQEESKRHDIFCKNMQRADRLNEANGSPAFGASKFADQTEDEISILLGRKDHGAPVPESPKVKEPLRSADQLRHVRAPQKEVLAGSTPSSVDWTSEGVVTPVKNQGQCGSCWAHSVTEEIESQWAMDGNAIWEFSVQQVNSCTDTCYGCGGGDTVYAYDYLMGLPQPVGLGSAAWGPYVQSMYELCESPRCTEQCADLNVKVLAPEQSLTGYFAQVTGYSYGTEPCRGSCDSQDTQKLSESVASYGPASICVNAGQWSLYTGGVLTQAACGGYAMSDIDHCVQLTGYNAEADEPYWIVRNSWATDWGENGFIYLQYPQNTCGLANEATYVDLNPSPSALAEQRATERKGRNFNATSA